ncbi:electron transfer flavoprotein subunit alpha/FixB family protein [Scrofimicrobium sp. R131]|uniref:Electron transfer flavoprotein subunit alpha/FixB family protein n=1 Tax=Scrofimicrobium appendicitidis TaxID=3079930 RepID=A0AAU7V991_9ACTO
MEKPIIVAVEREGEHGGLTKAMEQVIGAAHQLTTGPVWAVSAAAEPDLADLGAAGVSEVFIRAGGADPRLPAATAELVAAVIDERGPVGAVILPGTYWGKETCGHLSALIDGAAAVDVATVGEEDGQLVASKSVLGGTWVTRFKLERGVPLVALTGSATFPLGATPTICQLTALAVAARPEVSAVQVVSARRQEGDASARLAEADIVVVGGRGAEDNFELVHEVAQRLGGAVGATRVACDEGLADRALQVGQTGITIAPRLYLGLGVSGAIHHTCGMQGSEVIVAVCDDPDAPIFELADFGIVGDVNEVVPQLLATLT